MLKNEPDFLHYKKFANMETVGDYDIPVLKGIKIKDLSSVKMVGFNYATNPENYEKLGDRMIHFFLPDTIIERVWNNPDGYIPVLNQYRAVMQPDFSQYLGMPRAMLIWQHYRRMALSGYLQNQGLKIIPTPCWSDEGSFEYCFEGMPKKSLLCISTVGCIQNPYTRVLFNRGFDECLRQLEPSQLILYGVIDDDIRRRVGKIPYVHVESDMKQRINKYNSEK